MANSDLVLRKSSLPAFISPEHAESLIAWFNLYMQFEAAAGSLNTAEAKRRDINAFLDFFTNAVGSDHPDHWTRSMTVGFLRHLEKKERKSPTTINRALATIRHCANWIHRHRPFLAGNPCERVNDMRTEAPEWKGLRDIEITRLKTAAEQFLHLKKRKNQNPIRDYAIFLVLLHTGLRISELLALELDQYHGKHFTNVRRKGKGVTRKVFLAQEAREALERYVAECRGRLPGPLFCSRSGVRLARQNVDQALKLLADQANARLPKDQRIHLSAHLLRHTMLRKTAVKYGVQYAMELAGHSSSRYIWRYVQPSQEEKEAALEELFE
jgi:integrase/recombinase XerD